MKASEKQDLTKKLVTRLEKQFGRPPQVPDRSVLDTLVYAVCLENDRYEAADRAYKILHEEFHDLNEIRVSTVSELRVAFQHQADPDVRSHRVRTILQYVFEDQFEFDLEAIRKKTQEQAAKKLGKIRDLSPFVRNYVQQIALGAHLIPMDDRMMAAAIWLGLVEPGTSTEAASDALKAAVRKADAPAFCHLMRCFAVEEPASHLFETDSFSVPEEGYSASDAVKRLEEQLGGKSRAAVKAKPAAKPAKKAAKAATPKEVPSKKASKPASATKGAAAKKPKGRSRAAS